jgi:hypothetical protein
MPAGNLAAAPLIGWIQSLPCRARAPEGWLDDATRAERAAAAYDDARRFPRFFCRGQAARAALEYQQSLPALPRKKGWHGVNLVDLSRGGCSFLHHEPLYPGEQMRMILMTSLRPGMEVVWCRRLQADCFFVGVKFIVAAAGEAGKADSD